MRLVEQSQIVVAFGPVDMNTGANSGDWVSMKNFNHLSILLVKAAGTAGDDPIFKLQQATAVAGTAAKDLLFTDVYIKAGTLTSIGTFTKVTQPAATSYTDATHAEIAAVYAVELNAEDLDADGGFDCVQLSVADVGSAAQLGVGIYFLSEPRYAAGASTPSAIVD